MKMLVTNRKITLLILLIIVSICGLQGGNHFAEAVTVPKDPSFSDFLAALDNDDLFQELKDRATRLCAGLEFPVDTFAINDDFTVLVAHTPDGTGLVLSGGIRSEAGGSINLGWLTFVPGGALRVLTHYAPAGVTVDCVLPKVLEVLVVDPDSPPIYWTDYGTDKIQRANLDGSNVQDLVTSGLTTPVGIALDIAGGKMYWTDYGTEKIQRANLDGSNVQDLVTSGLTSPNGIALDIAGGKMYWTDFGTEKIQRANLDGSNVQDLVTSGLTIPASIALDIAGGKMYWTDPGTEKIQRANLDGSNVQDLVTSGLTIPDSIALDIAGGKMYWTDFGTEKIQRANLDGSNVQDLVTSGLNTPLGIALDIAGGKMYWTHADWNSATSEFTNGKIQRANLNGTEVEDVITGLDVPDGIALGILYQNRAPVFSAGASTTRTVAEDTGAGVNIGSAVSATDVDNDTLTYTLSGTDAASFDIVRTSGQLQTKSALDYATKTSYTVTVTVSDGTLTDSITVSITVTDVTEETVSASTPTSLTEATVDESVVTLTLTGGTYEQSIGTIRNNVTVSGIAGVTAKSSDVLRVSDTVVTVELTFDGTDFDTDATLTFTVGADAIANYNGPALTAIRPVTAVLEENLTITVSLEQVGADQFKAIVSSAVPFNIVLPVSITNGSISGGAPTTTIPAGTVESAPLTVTRTPGTSDDITVNIGTLPGLPPNHQGYTLVKSNALPLTLITTVAETSLMAIEGAITNEDGSPAEAGLEVTVLIGSNTQTGVSEVGGVYTVTFFNLQGDVVATSGDTVTVQVRNPNTGAAAERTVPLSSQQILAKQATIDLQFSPTPSTTDQEYLLSVPARISLIHVPLKVTAVDGVAQTIESVGDLYDALGGQATVALLITYDPETGRWNSYLHDGHRGRPGDKALTDDLGIIASMKVAKSVRLSGDALGTNGRSSITLHPGVNLVGVPLRDSRITRVSDLFKLNGIAGNVSVIIVSHNGFKVVAQAKDPGDIPVTGGGAFILTARNAATVEITGTKWSNPLGQTAAPSTALTGIQTDGVTPVLAVTGSISPVVGKSVSRPFHVTVKNRSTGTVDTAMTDDDEVSYQFTFVDIETGRAAQVGDILEITAHSPDPFVGVHPVRHTVTADDVERSWISLGALVAYEIPAKTELLLNYPNPFNPETWIPYRLAKDAFVTVTIYDQRGRVVRDIAVGHRIAAVYESRAKAVYWDGRTDLGERVASGIYFYTLTAGDYSATRKMVILK